MDGNYVHKICKPCGAYLLIGAALVLERFRNIVVPISERKMLYPIKLNIRNKNCIYEKKMLASS